MSTLERLLFASAAILLVLLTTGCVVDTADSRVSLYIREWYRDQGITIPFHVDGEARYAEYTYEFDDGSGWVTGSATTFRLPRFGGGLIEFEAADPARDHRLTVSVLGRSAAEEPLLPVDTVVQTFRIDSTTPGADAASLDFRLYVDGSATPVPEPLPDFFDPWLKLELEVDHVEFDNPSGSPTRVYVTSDGSVPNEWSEQMDTSRRFEIWPGGSSGPYFFELKFMAIDEAGNRSGVRTLILESF